jgi:hypothetical protein
MHRQWRGVACLVSCFLCCTPRPGWFFFDGQYHLQPFISGFSSSYVSRYGYISRARTTSTTYINPPIASYPPYLLILYHSFNSFNTAPTYFRIIDSTSLLMLDTVVQIGGRCVFVWAPSSSTSNPQQNPSENDRSTGVADFQSLNSHRH